MSRHRIGLSRMQWWSEPFIGAAARDLHRLGGDGYFDFSSEYRANLHGFNRVGSFGFVPESTNEMYLQPIDRDPVDIDQVEFYNGLREKEESTGVEDVQNLGEVIMGILFQLKVH